MLVTIAILSGGLVFILAGFNSSLNALGTSRNVIRATQILEERMRELEQQAEEEDGLLAGESEEEVGKFTLTQEVVPLEETALPVEEDSLWDEEIAPVVQTALSEIKLSLHWSEGTRERKLSLVNYIKSGIIEEEEGWEESEE